MSAPMTLREVWMENRRRRAEGLPEVDRNGQMIYVKPVKPFTDEQLLELAERTRQTYDPGHPRYCRNQGD